MPTYPFFLGSCDSVHNTYLYNVLAGIQNSSKMFRNNFDILI